MATEGTTGKVLLRGLGGRCGRCGAKGIFETYFRLRERCPVCGYRFVREEGAFTMVMLLNVVVTFTLMFISLAAYVAWRGLTGEDVPLWPFGLACLASAGIVPLLFYPRAWSLWIAFDLMTKPLEAAELLDASAHDSRR